MDIKSYWKAVLEQEASAMRVYFREDAYVRWHNTNEQFTVEEFIQANCEYPGEWEGEIQRLEKIEDLVIAVVRVRAKDDAVSFHVVSFLKIKQDKICAIDEYWSEDGQAPQWRKEKPIGQKIERKTPMRLF